MDVLLPEQVTKEFPFLSASPSEGPDIEFGVHARRCGWLDAQQYGTLLLEQAKDAGVHFRICSELTS